MNIKYRTNMVDETVVAHTVYQVVLQWCVYQVENSVHINYLYLERSQLVTRVRIRVGIRVGIRVRIRVGIRVRIRVGIRVRIRVGIRVRIRVGIRVGIQVGI